MRKITFSDGHVITTKLTAKQALERMARLDTLRVLTEGYEEGEGLSIYNKAVKAYEKAEGFTGIIRLTFIEKDFLSYLLHEQSYLNEKEIETLKFYLRQSKEREELDLCDLMCN